MNNDKNELLSLIWTFVRGDLAPLEFEKSIYEHSELEKLMPPDLYLTVLSFDYRAAKLEHMQSLQKTLAEWLKSTFPLPCPCSTWSNQKSFILSSDDEPYGDYLSATFFEKNYSSIQKRTPWQEAVKCHTCGAGWLVGIDTVDDDILLRRLSETQLDEILSHGKWPNYFDDKPHLWPQGE